MPYVNVTFRLLPHRSTVSIVTLPDKGYFYMDFYQIGIMFCNSSFIFSYLRLKETCALNGIFKV